MEGKIVRIIEKNVSMSIQKDIVTRGVVGDDITKLYKMKENEEQTFLVDVTLYCNGI